MRQILRGSTLTLDGFEQKAHYQRLKGLRVVLRVRILIRRITMAKNGEQYGPLNYGSDYELSNTHEDKENREDYQYISAPPDEIFGWEWKWTESNSEKPLGYPEVIFGKKPWASQSTCSELPIIIADINKCDAKIDIDTKACGKYNVALDIWITDCELSSEHTIACEVMVWLRSEIMKPNLIDGKAVIPDSQLAATFHEGFAQDGWPCYTFVLDSSKAASDSINQEIKLKPLLDFLLEQNKITDDQFLASIELGNEIYYGEGKTVLNDFSVTIG